MKRKLLLCLLLLLLSALLLAACGNAESDAAGEDDGAAQAAQGESGAADAEDALPRTVELDAAASIFDTPSYDGVYQRIVGEDGVYTIVEEADDGEGSRWGKLKSGAGWVDLTAAEAFAAAPPVLSVCYAEESLLAGEVIEHIVDSSEYMERIALRSRQELTDVRLYAMVFGEDGYAPGEELDALDVLPVGTALVLGVTFPGDMSCYGIACRDSAGTEHWYTVSVSGRNGALVLSDLTDETP